MRSFIPVYNILPCKAMLFSTPFTKQLIIELKLLVMNTPKEVFGTPRGSRWSRGLGRAEDFYGSRCDCTVVSFDAIDLKKLRNSAL